MGDLRRFNSLFDDTFFNHFFHPASEQGERTPAMDVRESEKGYGIDLDLPGVSKEDIHIHVDNGVLTIEAETHNEEKEEKDGKLIRQERHYGQYVRRLSVGDNVDPNQIKARFEAGVLHLELPKPVHQPEHSRRIEIN